MDDGLTRCWWAAQPGPRADPLMLAYHDEEWGVPVEGDAELFERLSLEAFQAGLSWQTILAKRAAFREAFLGFEPALVASFGDADRERLLGDAGIVRNPAKIEATIGNASAAMALIDAHGSLAAYLARLIPPPPHRLAADARRGDVPSTTADSDRLARDLAAHGFRFVGSTIVYAFMQSVGLVDDHLPGCFRYRG